MDVLVAYEGQRGRAGLAADAIAKAAGAYSIPTLVREIDDIAPGDFAVVDALIAGCWTPGDVPFGGEPTLRMASWIESLQPFDGMPIGVFCTYTFFPHTFADTAARTAETLNEMSNRFELRGGRVVASRSMYIKSLADAAADLVGRVLEQLPGN